MSRKAKTVLVLLVVGVAVTASALLSSFRSVTPDPREVESHRNMLVLLADLARRESLESVFFGTQMAGKFRAMVASPPAGISPQELCGLYFHLGLKELQLGREREGIDALTTAYEMLPSLTSVLKRENHLRVMFYLAVAHLRLGETQNCCQRNTPESCLLPIRGGGIHTNPEGSRSAIAYLEQILANTKREEGIHLKALWLLNLAYMTLDEHPEGVPAAHLIPPAAYASDEDFPRFENIAARLGLDAFSQAGGVIVDDFDNDDHLDVVVSAYSANEQLLYFRNNRDGTFTESSEAAGLKGIFGGLNIVQADYDNDGNLDIFVPRGAWLRAAGRQPNSLLRGQDDGTFLDVTLLAGLADEHYPTQTAAWADYDLDGDLDLYVGNEHSSAIQAPSQLFVNQGDGTFVDLAQAAGVTNDRFAKGVVWGDYDADGLPDLYVSNLPEPNRLYRNLGNGKFADVAETVGVTNPAAGFACWFWDFDNDGVLDIFATSYAGDITDNAAAALGLPFQAALPCLYRGNGRGGFEEVGRRANLVKPLLPMGANFGDADGDGFLDFYLGTGDPDYSNLMPSVFYRNRQGKSFADVSSSGGFGHLQKGHGIAFADLDNDGDQDIFAQMGGAYPGDRYGDSLYLNPGFGHRWIAVKLVGVTSNRSAIGARIRVLIEENEERRSIYRHVTSGGSFGASPLRQNIGLGNASRIIELEVTWPAKQKKQLLSNVALDQTIEIVEDRSGYRTLRLRPLKL